MAKWIGCGIWSLSFEVGCQGEDLLGVAYVRATGHESEVPPRKSDSEAGQFSDSDSDQPAGGSLQLREETGRYRVPAN